MTTIKFDKSVKYQGVRYAAHEAFKVADEDVDQLKAAGATVLSVDPPVTPPAPPVTPPASGNDGDKDADEDEEEEEQGQAQQSNEDVAQLKEKLLEYTVPELVKFAEEHNIDLQKKTKKAEIYNIIVAALE